MKPAAALHPLRHDAATATVRSATRVVLELAPGWAVQGDPAGAGLFLQFMPADVAPYVEQALGNVHALERFVCVHRFSPFWTQPATGTQASQVPRETLWLLARSEQERGATTYTLLVPLLDALNRHSLRGSSQGLLVCSETGDPSLACGPSTAVFVATGPDPYALLRAAAHAVQQHLGLGRLRREKQPPDFADWFGWCTWDAFYKAVTPQKVIQGLASFEQAGVQPRFLILDDGWQSWQRTASGEDRLASLAPNAHFGSDLSDWAHTIKTRFGVRCLLVWHALMGYWGGLAEPEFERFGVRSVGKSFGPGLLAQEPRWNVWPWGAQMGVPGKAHWAGFFDELHAGLKRQGVDGVKVDAQALLEGVCAGQGGRMAMALACRSALEASVNKHFGGRMINCMSATSECAYLCAHSSLMRSSDDFFPARPESHGQHVYVNAVAGLWFGQFMHLDWDMFQSGHAKGAFHAAARAISGGPVYVSDGLGQLNTEVLRKLVLSDGSVLRADEPGCPAPDSLFVDPTREPVLLKVYNRNRDCALLGLFHVNEQEGPLTSCVGPGDVPGWPAQTTCVAWAHRAKRLWRCGSWPGEAFEVAPGEWELVTLAPIEHGFAAIGLADKYNSSGAIVSRTWHEDSVQIELRDGGQFLAWAVRAPRAVACDGVELPFTFNAASGALHLSLPVGGGMSLCITWEKSVYVAH